MDGNFPGGHSKGRSCKSEGETLFSAHQKDLREKNAKTNGWVSYHSRKMFRGVSLWWKNQRLKKKGNWGSHFPRRVTWSRDQKLKSPKGRSRISRVNRLHNGRKPSETVRENPKTESKPPPLLREESCIEHRSGALPLFQLKAKHQKKEEEKWGGKPKNSSGQQAGCEM